MSITHLLPVLLSLAAAVVVGSIQGEPPSTRVPDCTTGGCHAKEVDHLFLHGPVAGGSCEACHEYTDERTHAFRLVRDDATLCAFCHSEKTDARLNLHDPVEKGQCLTCHHPHGSAHAMMLRGGSPAEVCRSCHADIATQAHVHTPVGEGDCGGCHRAHGSTFSNLLVDEGRSLCLRCHAKFDLPEPVPGRPAGAAGEPSDRRPMHEPVLVDCRFCHEVHAAEHRGLLTATPKVLCLGCHPAIADEAFDSATRHSVVTDEQACLNCHTPHQSDFVPLLKSRPVTLCLDCHARAVQRSDGSTVAAVAEITEAGALPHGPLATGKCQSCHAPHGGRHRALLTHDYAGGFYQPYSREAYALCFQCHDPKLIEETPTSDATGFRDGRRNLHYVHVAEPGSDRGCRACHATHAAKSPKLLHEAAPFGQWAIPIRFEQTETGGRCAAGCHRAREYRRGEPAAE